MSTRAEPDAGRAFEMPTHLGARNWWHVAKRIFRDLSKDHLSLVAAGCAFYAMLAIVPALTALILVYGLVFDPASVRGQLEVLSGLIPDGMQTMLQDQLTRIAETSDSRLGWSLGLALALALWPASAGIRALIQAMNIAYHEEEKRNFLLYQAIGLGFTLLAIIAMTWALFVILGVPAILAIVGLARSPSRPCRWRDGRCLRPWSCSAWASSTATGRLATSQDKVGHHRRRRRHGHLDTGVGRLLALHRQFRQLQRDLRFARRCIVVLLWLYISAFVVILGAKLNSEVEHETSVDTTVGAPKPQGKRGAYVADHVPEGPIAEDRCRMRTAALSVAGLPLAIVIAVTVAWLALERGLLNGLIEQRIAPATASTGSRTSAQSGLAGRSAGGRRAFDLRDQDGDIIASLNEASAVIEPLAFTGGTIDIADAAIDGFSVDRWLQERLVVEELTDEEPRAGRSRFARCS